MDIEQRIKKSLATMNKVEEDAAVALASLKYYKLNQDTANKLQALKRKFASHQIGYSTMDGTQLPRLPPFENLKDCIGTISAPFEKQVTPSDVDDGQNRFALNKLFVETNYLPMLHRGENVAKGIPVVIYGPEGGEFDMTFKFWSNKNYVINGGWRSFRDRYQLRPCSYWITVWMFRHKQSDHLCFALTWRYLPGINRLISTRGRKVQLSEDGDENELRKQLL